MLISLNKNPIKRIMLLGFLTGTIIYICLCGVKTLNPFNYDWILNIYHDSTLSFWGWIFYEKAPFSDGLFSCFDLSYPHSLSIIFTDAIIPFAIILKPIVRLLLHDHTIIQYLGLWSLTCYILQGVFASLIFFKTTKNNIGRMVGIIICCLSPIMAQRLYMHNTLLAQWLILAAFCICVYENELQNKKYLFWILLFGISSMIHLYFVPMIAIVFCSEMFYEMTIEKNVKKQIITAVLSLISSVGIVAILGGFSTEIAEADQAWSYTILYKYSSNLMTGFIPLGNSFFMPEIPMMPEEYEGFAYLGLGIILALMVLIPVIIFAFLKKRLFIKNKKHFWCMLGCFIISYIIAVGPRITFFDKQLLFLDLPNYIDYIAAIFRSIGRFIWIAYYMVIIVVISLISNLSIKKIFPDSKKYKTIINISLVVLLFIQVVDLSPMIKKKHSSLRNIDSWQTKMKSERWNEIKDKFDYVYIITAGLTSYPTQKAYSMYMYAYNNDLKLTSSYFAHENDTLLNESNEYYNDIILGFPLINTLYWFENEELYNEASAYIHCEKIDDYLVGWVDE